jgi:hypothetical protein
LLRRVDARWLLAFGTILIGVACLMATNLTSQWATDDFLPSQILQAIGQSFALTALIVLIVQSIHPADALTIGSLLQISRLFGGEIGTAFMQTFVRANIGRSSDTASRFSATKPRKQLDGAATHYPGSLVRRKLRGLLEPLDAVHGQVAAEIGKSDPNRTWSSPTTSLSIRSMGS